LKFLLIISTILFSSLFLVSQDAYAVYTEWYWVGGTGTSWSETNNWVCANLSTFDDVFPNNNPPPCPTPGYPVLISTTNPDDPDPNAQGLPDLIFISQDVGTFSFDFWGVNLQTTNGAIEITIDADVVTEPNTDFFVGPIEVTTFDIKITNISDLVIGGNFNLEGNLDSTLENTAAGTITNTGFTLNQFKIQNFGLITTASEFHNPGQIINECGSTFAGTITTGNQPEENCAAAILYGIGWNPGVLYTFDPSTEVWTADDLDFLGLDIFEWGATAMAVHPTSGLIYASIIPEFDNSVSERILAVVDPDALTVTPVVDEFHFFVDENGANLRITGFAFALDGTLFGVTGGGLAGKNGPTDETLHRIPLNGDDAEIICPMERFEFGAGEEISFNGAGKLSRISGSAPQPRLQVIDLASAVPTADCPTIPVNDPGILLLPISGDNFYSLTFDDVFPNNNPPPCPTPGYPVLISTTNPDDSAPN